MKPRDIVVPTFATVVGVAVDLKFADIESAGDVPSLPTFTAAASVTLDPRFADAAGGCEESNFATVPILVCCCLSHASAAVGPGSKIC